MTMPQRKVSSWQRKVDQMHELALDLGYFCTSAVSYKVDLASTIASSIRPRSGTSVYQSVAISLANVPLEFARQTFFHYVASCPLPSLWCMLGGVITSSRFQRLARPQNKRYLTSIPLKGDFIMYTAAVSKKIPP